MRQLGTWSVYHLLVITCVCGSASATINRLQSGRRRLLVHKRFFRRRLGNGIALKIGCQYFWGDMKNRSSWLSLRWQWQVEFTWNVCLLESDIGTELRRPFMDSSPMHNSQALPTLLIASPSAPRKKEKKWTAFFVGYIDLITFTVSSMQRNFSSSSIILT